MLTICIVDPDKQFRRNLERLFKSFDAPSEGFEAGDGYISSETFKQEHVAVITLMQADIDGFDLLRLSLKGQAVAVFAVMDEPSVPDTVRAMRLGVADVFVKPVSIDPIIRASRFGRGFTPENPLDANQLAPATKPLSKREHEVLEFLLAGKTCKDAAKAMKISVRTAEAHRKNIYQKTGVKSQVDLVRKLNC